MNLRPTRKINKQYLKSQKLYQYIFELQRLYYGNAKVRKALLRWPKKYYNDLPEMDQLRMAKKLLPLTK